jgi:hypothetical protein
MAGSWQGLADELNNLFTNNRLHIARKFRERHGNDGNGQGPNPIPYKFGRFIERFAKPGTGGAAADEVLPEAQKARFLIDAGLRRWDPASITRIEDVIKHSLTRDNTLAQPDPKQITFEVITDYTATLASAEVFDDSKSPRVQLTGTLDATQLAAVDRFHITIKCPP